MNCPVCGRTDTGCGFDCKTIPDHIYCWGHNKIEHLPEEPYRICGECFHVYATPQDLELMYLEQEMDDASHEWIGPHERREIPVELRRPVIGKPVEQIYFCVVCIHDF